jgi:hypothetical protein
MNEDKWIVSLIVGNIQCNVSTYHLQSQRKMSILSGRNNVDCLL